MASSATHTTIDVDGFDTIDTTDGGADLLNFQDIPHDIPTKNKGETHEFTNFPHSAADSDDESSDQAKLLQDEKRASSFWTFAYYQQFFDVETKQVGQRILGSMLPRPGKNYLVKQIRPNPDLYGPFWICTTLVFTTAIAGNLANYFSLAGKNYNWKYDFHKVTFAATAIFSYWWLIPLILFGILWWRGSQAKFTFLEIICVYGYSLAIYIPISVLWAIQVFWLQWTLVIVGAVLSGSVLLLTFWPTVSEDNKKIAVGVMFFIFIMHTALAAGFVLYFFHVPGATTNTPVIPTNTTVINTTTDFNMDSHHSRPTSQNLQKVKQFTDQLPQGNSLQQARNKINQNPQNIKQQQAVNDNNQNSQNNKQQQAVNDYSQNSQNNKQQQAVNDYSQNSQNINPKQAVNDNSQNSQNINPQQAVNDNSQNSQNIIPQQAVNDNSQNSQNINPQQGA